MAKGEYKYKKEYAQRLLDYFMIEPYEIEEYKDEDGHIFKRKKANDLPLLSRFAVKIGVTREMMWKWSTEQTKKGEYKHPEFRHAYLQAKECQDYILITNGLHGLYNNNFAWGTAKNIIGFRDKIENETISINGNYEITSDEESENEKVISEKINKLLRLRANDYKRLPEKTL